MKEQHGMLMEDIQARMASAAEDSRSALTRNQKLLKNLDGRLRTQSSKVGSTLERLQEEVGSKVSETELRDLHERIKNENDGIGETVDGIHAQIQSLTTKNDVQKMIAILRKKQDELSAIGVKCLVCSQNVPGGMASKAPSWKHKQFPSPGGHKLGSGVSSLEELRTKTFDSRVGNKLNGLLSSPLRRAGALKQMRSSKNKNTMLQDGYGPVGWSRIESNEAYVSRVVGHLPQGASGASGAMGPQGPQDDFHNSSTTFSPVTGHKELKVKLKMKPRNANSTPTFPELAASGGDMLEYGLSVKKRSHLLRL